MAIISTMQHFNSTDSGSDPKMNSFIALTGGTGFIGTRLLQQLVAKGWKVRALYRPSKGVSPELIPGVEWFAGDLEHAPVLETFVEGAFAVIHCAGVVRGANRQAFDKVNAEGTRRVAQATSKTNPQARFLLISSLAAREPELSHYAGSKFRGECAVKAVSDSLRWTVIRPPAVYGPGDRELLPLFRSIARGFAPLPAGAKGRFSMIYVDDLVKAVILLLSRDTACGKTIEIDDGHQGGYDWDTVLQIGGRVLRKGAPVRRLPVPVFLLKLVAWVNLVSSRIFGYAPMLTPGKVREITHPDWISDNSQLIENIDWQPAYELGEGLADIFGIKSVDIKEC